MPEIQLRVRSVRQMSTARRAIRGELLERGLDEGDVANGELVLAELLGAAYDSNPQSPMVVTVESFARLHGVRLCGIKEVELRDSPFHLRERVLHTLTLAFGQRRNADGTTDLWAEIPRTRRASY